MIVPDSCIIFQKLLIMFSPAMIQFLQNEWAFLIDTPSIWANVAMRNQVQ
ncbi:hypothetical protein GDO78_002647 [Eleutherodactylus coqui]|uniref:Uncharacterized protein n=1 Tax=Eleutherodactylus coqui TaxID=57060 RepID=A0A8J6EYX0_ELECQ|nr:hypothetical protein GDO78_002647 [Eleutherodactylus coqui]